MAYEILNQPNQVRREHGLLPILRDLAPFAAGETRTSDWMRSETLSKVCGSAFADQAGTLTVQFSGSGVGDEVDHEEPMNVGANAPSNGFIFDQILPWVRLSYTNGVAASSQSRLFLFGRATS